MEESNSHQSISLLSARERQVARLIAIGDFDIDQRKPSRLRLKNHTRNLRTRNQNRTLWN